MQSAKQPEPARPSAEIEVKSDADGQFVRIHNSVIAVIARLAVEKISGVHQLSGSLVDEIAGMVGKKSPEKGIHVTVEEDGISLEVQIIVNYGVFIPKVAWQVQHDVREAVEKMTGNTVKAVNVVVRSVHLPESPAAVSEK